MTISPAISERDHVAFGCDDSVRFALDQHSLLDRHVAPVVHIILNPSHLDLKTLTVDEMICCNTCHTNSWGISSQIYRFLFLSYTCHTNSWGISCQIYLFYFWVTHVTQIRGASAVRFTFSISELHMSHIFVGHQLSDVPLSISELHMSHKFVGHQLSDLPLSISELHMSHTFVGTSAVRFTAFYSVLSFTICNI